MVYTGLYWCVNTWYVGTCLRGLRLSGESDWCISNFCFKGKRILFHNHNGDKTNFFSKHQQCDSHSHSLSIFCVTNWILKVIFAFDLFVTSTMLLFQDSLMKKKVKLCSFYCCVGAVKVEANDRLQNSLFES